ncbi:MAG: LysM peptidoglycan-binding domain-containing protein [Pseudohongiellaceae bacterium]
MRFGLGILSPGIAIRIQTDVEVLRSVNQIKGSRIIAGDSLLVPRTTDPALLANITQNQRTSRRILPIPSEYIVRSGDNLWTIARRFDIKSAEIALWNNISVNSILQPGQELSLAFLKNSNPTTEVSNTSTARDYRVQSGDSMIGIAKRFSIDLIKLLNWNNLMPNDLIFPRSANKNNPT